mgnify:CR=1 FL=1
MSGQYELKKTVVVFNFLALQVDSTLEVVRRHAYRLGDSQFLPPLQRYGRRTLVACVECWAERARAEGAAFASTALDSAPSTANEV